LTSDSESPLQRLRRIEAEERAVQSARASAPTPASAPAANPASAREVAAPRRRGFVATVFGALLFALAKGKVLLGALKFGALLQTFSTLALSATLYSRYYGWRIAVGFVLLILVHEYGHGIAAKIMGLRVGAPIFIPFFGAVIALKEQPRSTWVDAVVGYGGPLAGTFGGACALATGLCLGRTQTGGMLVALAWMTFTLNLFNLIPVIKLDGDRITQPFRPWFWIPGGFVLLGLVVASSEATGHLQPFLLIMLIAGAVKGFRLARFERLAPATPSLLAQVTQRERYVEESGVQPWQRAASAYAYFGLAAVLGTLMLWSQHLAQASGVAS
jgi:Zn-dependent protease